MKGRRGSVKTESTRVRIIPPKMTKGARRFWDQLEPKIPTLAPIHAPLLADFCRCLDWVDRLEKRILREGIVIKGDRGGRIRNPVIQTLREYRLAVQRYGVEFGCTPWSIVRLTGQPAGDDKQPIASRGHDPDDPLSGRWKKDGGVVH